MGIENIDSDKLRGWAAFINNLTPQKILLAIALAFGLVFAYSLYEHKASLPQMLSSNPPLLYALVGLIGLGTVGGMFNSLQTRIDIKQQEVMKELRHRITDQEQNNTANITRLEKQLESLEQRERDCNERHNALVIDLAKKGFYRDDA